MTIDNIYIKCKENDFKASELDLISKADKLLEANKIDKEQALIVADIVANLNADSTTVIAALLYNSVLKEELSLENVRDEFGDSIANVIENLSIMDNLKLNDYTESSSIYLRKVLVGISEDVRVLIIKLADRLVEMRECYKYNEEEKKRIINETMNVLIPIAHRLGINSIKSELENLCLQYSKPDVYNEILEKLDGTYGELSMTLEDMKQSIIDILTEHGINFKIKARVKSVYSIYNKLSTGRKWSDIYDILAMRLIVPTVEDCYLAVGLIHAKYRPIPKRFKDYIAMPKENMYQSLHTSVFGIDGHIFEIQIRTPEMDEIAEHGIASHWSYKEHSTKVVQNLMEQKLEIFRNTIDLARKDNDEVFAKSMENELLSKLIYVFTPKGDVMELPLGSTPVDFAYRIHSDIGDKMVGAIVNDQIVPLDYELQDGDYVKINTNKNSKPNEDWLKFVKTAQAKNKIKAYFSKVDRENYIIQGKELLEKEVRKQKLSFNSLFTEENINKILKDLKLKTIDDLYLSIGSLRYTANYIISLITEDKKDIADLMIDRVNRKRVTKQETYKNDIIVSGTDNILVSLAKCCNPIPGDEIIGYITKGAGVSVHKDDCPNIKNLDSRLINVEWNNFDTVKLFNANITVKTNSNKNEILALVTVASTRNIRINSINEQNSGNVINYQMSLSVQNKHELSLFIEDIRNLNFVVEVIR